MSHESEYRGDDAIAKLAAFRIFVAGAGAIGSNLLDNLARIGCESLSTIDFDRIELANIGTQRYGRKDVGNLKATTIAANTFRDTGSIIKCEIKKIESHNAPKFLSGHELIVDCFDNHDARKVCQDFAHKYMAPCLHVGVSNDGYGECVWWDRYTVPPPPDNEGKAPCDEPISRNLIMLTMIVATEAIIDFVTSGTKRSWRVTLQDRKVTEIK